MENKEVNHGLKTSLHGVHCLKWSSHCLFIWHNTDRNSQIWSDTESSIRCITIKGRFLMLHFYSNLFIRPVNFNASACVLTFKCQIRILSGCSDIVHWMTNGIKIRKSGLSSTFCCLFVWFFKISVCLSFSMSEKRNISLVHICKVFYYINYIWSIDGKFYLISLVCCLLLMDIWEMD